MGNLRVTALGPIGRVGAGHAVVPLRLRAPPLVNRPVELLFVSNETLRNGSMWPAHFPPNRYFMQSQIDPFPHLSSVLCKWAFHNDLTPSPVGVGRLLLVVGPGSILSYLSFLYELIRRPDDAR